MQVILILLNKIIFLTPKQDKKIIFSGSIDLSNIDTVNILASKFNSNKAVVSLDKVVYRISNREAPISYNNINDKNIHFDFAHTYPYSFRGASINIDKESVIYSNEINMYISAGSFDNHGTINNQGSFYFDAYSSEGSHYINTGKILTDDFVLDEFSGADSNIIENEGDGQFEIKNIHKL